MSNRRGYCCLACVCVCSVSFLCERLIQSVFIHTVCLFTGSCVSLLCLCSMLDIFCCVTSSKSVLLIGWSIGSVVRCGTMKTSLLKTPTSRVLISLVYSFVMLSMSSNRHRPVRHGKYQFHYMM